MKPVYLRTHRILSLSHVCDDFHIPYSIHKRVTDYTYSRFIIRAQFMIRRELEKYCAEAREI